ncbi:unnamed protein product [Symbiodinium sp. CCMP2456]|nr:unnamed protein product [Symbiodinium sp. CCMP2456]
MDSFVFFAQMLCCARDLTCVGGRAKPQTSTRSTGLSPFTEPGVGVESGTGEGARPDPAPAVAHTTSNQHEPGTAVVYTPANQPEPWTRAIPKRRAKRIDPRCDGIFESRPTTRPAAPAPEATDESCTKEAQTSGADARAEPHVRWAARPLLARSE